MSEGVVVALTWFAIITSVASVLLWLVGLVVFHD
jgi:hypothetical protein